jgi:hypothetical protein
MQSPPKIQIMIRGRIGIGRSSLLRLFSLEERLTGEYEQN